MDALGQIGNVQDAFLAGVHKKATAQVSAIQKIGQLGQGSQREGADMEKVRQAGQDFEAFFVGQMMEQMMAGIESDSMFGGGQGEDVWRSMLNQEYGKEVAKSGRLGIADHVMATMLQAQEERTVAQKATAAPAPTNPNTTAPETAAAAAAGSLIRREE